MADTDPAALARRTAGAIQDMHSQNKNTLTGNYRGWGPSVGRSGPINTAGANANVRSGASGGSEAPDDAKFDIQGDWKAR